MEKSSYNRSRKILYPVVVTSAVLVGLTLLISGTGKIPGQTEFIWALLKSFWTPGMAYFIGSYLPWIEIILGVLLIFGILPRMAAALFLPVAAGFIANNSWAVAQGMEKLPACASCFGIWEVYLGSLSPLGALIFDIVLLGMALVVLLLHRESFIDFRPWFIRRKTSR